MDRIGRYKIVRELGRGAMGVVYHAIDPNIGRPVAIKTIQIGGARKPEDQDRLRERLFREARSAGALSHPGIVTVYDVEQQGDVAYIAMEYVDGPTLDQLMSQPKPLDPNRIFSILGQTAAALDYAHQKGIVHRDIKPANIMVTADGIAKIADFGIAKVTDNEHFTMTGSIVGTPHYMSPEQVQGQGVDGRSDQFSLAVIAYEMLTGEKPYTGEHLTTVVYKIVAEDPVPPHRLNATLTGPIENALRKALAKKPDARFRTCIEFAGTLEEACSASKGWRPLARGAGGAEPTAGDAAGMAAMTGKTTVPSMPPGRKPNRSGDATTVERAVKKKSGFMPFLAAILMAGALLALIGWQAAPWLGSDNRKQASPPDDTPVAVPQTPAPKVAANTQGKENPLGPPSTPPDQPAQTVPADTGGTKPVQTEPVQPPADAKPPETKPVEPAPSTPAKSNAEKSNTENSNTGKKPAAASPPAAAAPKRTTLVSAFQPIRIITQPNAATATLDGHNDAACSTPCALMASPGRHTVAISKAGFQLEHREINVVGDEPSEIPAIVLRALAGTLLLTSSPPGASIRIDGRALAEVTPTQLILPPGSYTVVIEKDGFTSTKTVDLKNGDLQSIQVPLGRK